MSFFSIEVYPSFIYGSVISYVLHKMYVRYKESRQEETNMHKKYNDRYYELYYRISQLEEKVQTLQEKQVGMFIHE